MRSCGGDGRLGKLGRPGDFGTEVLGGTDGVGVDAEGIVAGCGDDFECGVETVVGDRYF